MPRDAQALSSTRDGKEHPEEVPRRWVIGLRQPSSVARSARPAWRFFRMQPLEEQRADHSSSPRVSVRSRGFVVTGGANHLRRAPPPRALRGARSRAGTVDERRRHEQPEADELRRREAEPHRRASSRRRISTRKRATA